VTAAAARGPAPRSAGGPGSSPSEQQMPHMRKFADECGNDVGDWNELNARFVTARSLLDTFIDGDVSNDVVMMVQWASDMVELYEEIEKAYANDTDMKGPTEKRPNATQGGLVGWYYELEESRRDVADPDGASAFLSDTELSRMAELDRIAETHSSDEQLLHKMITRHDEVQKDITLLHRRCGVLCVPGSGVKRETVEELYLYLKEKVANAADLGQIADEMHEHVYTLVDSKKGGEIINVLLEMHVLEDEQSILRQRIDSLLGSPSRGDSKQSDAGGGVSSAFGDEGSNAENADSDAQSKNGGRSLESGGYALHPEEKDAKGVNPFSKYGGLPRDADIDDEALSAHVSNLKHAHKKSLASLQSALESEKNRKAQALEERLLRRKRAGEKDLAAARAKGVSEQELKDLEAQNRTALEEIEAEIERNEAEYKGIKDGVCGGFKKRCIYEIKATQARGQALNKEETDDAHKEAAEALKSRFFRDNKQLQESLEAERSKSRKKIMSNLEKRRRGANGDAQSLQEIDKEMKEMLDDMDLDFEEQEAAALSGPQGAILMSLSGIFANVDGILNASGSKGKASGHDDDDDEDFFDDEEAGHAGAKAWAEGISSLRDVYIDAGRTLQTKIRAVYQRDLSGADGEEVDENSSFGDITQHMTQVITNAYNSQLTDPDAIAALLKGQKAAAAIDSDRVKASILEEFERSREAYEEVLEGTRATSKAKLEKRRGNRHMNENAPAKDKDEKDSVEWGAESIRIKKTQAALEQVVDNFLEDPIVINQGGMRNPSLTAYSAKFDATKTSRHQQRKAAKAAAAAAAAAAANSSEVDDRADGKQSKNKAEEEREKAEFAQFKENQQMNMKKDSIKQKSEEREKELIDALTVEMQKKKHRLEERLRRKKESRSGARDADDMFGVESDEVFDEDELRAQKELDGMDEAFEKAVALLKRADEGRLQTVNVAQLIDVMDRLSKKASESGMRGTRSPHSHDMDDLQAKMEEDSLLSWEPVNDVRSNERISHTAQAIEARHAMEHEVSRITDTFNEERQKVDLMMKIQQARQKQVLQRKLLDRKQGQGISQGMQPYRGAGFSSDLPTNMATGGLGRQLPPLRGQNSANSGLGAAALGGTVGLNALSSPSLNREASTGIPLANMMRK